MPAGRQGLSLIELLIVIAILSVLSTLGLMNVQGQIAHAKDARRKIDVNTLSKFLENYYNDHGAFPNQSAVNGCDAPWESYILSIPCDPVSKKPYGYFPASNGGYRICATLADKTDRDIAGMNCTGAMGCSVGCGYNYCLASGVPASAAGTEDVVPCTP